MGRPASLQEAREASAAARRKGRRVVLANGCFDLIHVGHVRYLEGARALGDLLLVAVNSDRSVSALKGPGRPVMGEGDRLLLVAALEAVALAFPFDAPHVEGLLAELRPRVHAKGSDYTVEGVPERAAARALGIETRIVGDPKDHAVTSLLKRLREGR